MFAVWLLFQKHDHDYLYQIIKNLGRRYNSPIFLPHITVYGLVKTDFVTIENAVLESIKNIQPFEVEKIKIGYSDDFWKTLFIELNYITALNAVNRKLENLLSTYAKYDFFPHVSLLYKIMKEEEKIGLVNELKIKNKFTISKIGILKFSEKISEWKIVKEYEFGSI
jgi:2'-5' RNA ligase